MMKFPAVSAALPATLLAATLVACSSATPPPAPPPPQVVVKTITPSEASVTVDYVAQTEALNEVEIRPRVGGLLEAQAAVEGTRVKKGQLLFVIDAQPYEAAVAQAKAALALAQSAFDQADRDLARVKPLSTIDAVSQQELDAAIARHDASNAQVEAARAALQTAQLNLGYTRITSPIDGVIGRAQLKVGGLVTAYTTLLTTVYSTDPMYVNFAISESRVLEVQRELGMALDQAAKSNRSFKVLLGDGSEYPYPGRLNFIDAAVDSATGTLKLRLEVPNPEQLLRANQFARVRVTTQNLKDALLVPQRAVQEFQGKNYVWVIDAESKAQQRDVTMGARVDPNWIVAKGLNVGDVVVIEGMQKMKPGIAVKARDANAPPPAPAQAATSTEAKPAAKP